MDPENEEAKRFDLLALSLQLSLLRHEPGFVRLREQVKQIVGLLEEKATIPMVGNQMPLIQDVQTDEWWEDVTVPMLEAMRRRLRSLVRLIDKRQRKPVYTNFEDLMGGEIDVELPGFSPGTNYVKFLAKTRAFLREHMDHVAIAKLRTNRPLTVIDLAELERIWSKAESANLTTFGARPRSPKDLDCSCGHWWAWIAAPPRMQFGASLPRSPLSANQIEFVNLVVDHLTEHGIVAPDRLYESPFTDLTPRGPDDLFSTEELDELIQVLDTVRVTAMAA